jgi:carbon starvation protein
MIGYGSMLMEGLVGVVAPIAAAALPNSMDYDINIDLARRPADTAQLKALDADHAEQAGQSELVDMEKDVGESLHGRTGGAVTPADPDLGLAPAGGRSCGRRLRRPRSRRGPESRFRTGTG